MTLFCAMLVMFLSLTPASRAAELDVTPSLDMTNPAALQEATRVLEEEVKLAARPQTYVLIDLAANVLVIKGRGVELHRIPIESWSASHLAQLTSLYRLNERPAVNRRKIDPAVGAEQDPISLADMPTAFALHFSPPLVMLVFSRPDNPWQWTLQRGGTWWRRLRAWEGFFWMKDQSSSPVLDLTVSVEQAQSLAWTVTENMPFLLRRPAAP